MPKFDETKERVEHKGDEYDRLRTETTCMCCHARTRFYSISFGAGICSTECADITWQNYWQASTQEPEDDEFGIVKEGI